MKTRQEETILGIRFTVTSYGPEDVEAFMADDDAIEWEMGSKGRRFEPREGEVRALLETYGPNGITLSHLSDNYLSPEEGHIIRASSLGSGEQAMEFIEYCLNSVGKMAGMPLRRYQRFSYIPFHAWEHIDGKRTLRLGTAAEHPEIAWREAWNIYVAESWEKGEFPSMQAGSRSR